MKIGNELAGGREKKRVNSTLRCTNIREGQSKEFEKRPEKRQVRGRGHRRGGVPVVKGRAHFLKGCRSP